MSHQMLHRTVTVDEQADSPAARSPVVGSHSDRICLTYARVGGAHRAVAEAVREGLVSVEPTGPGVEIRDLGPLLGPAWRLVESIYGPLVRRAPGLYNAAYDLTSIPWVWARLLQQAAHPSALQGLQALLEEDRPTCLVSIFHLASSLLADAREFLGMAGRLPLVVVVVDLFTIHPAWAEPRADLFLVPTPEAGRCLAALGVPRKRIRLIRYPVRSAVGAGDKGAPSAAQGSPLRERPPLIVIMGGCEGALNLETVVRPLLRVRERWTVVAVPGRDRGACAALQDLARRDQGRLRVATNWDEVPRLLTAADLVVTKPGPSTLMEALELGVPVLLTGPVTRQEEANIAYVTSRGLGTYVREAAVAETAASLLQKAAQLAVQEAARRERSRLPKTTAASAILELVSATTRGSARHSASIPRRGTAALGTSAARAARSAHASTGRMDQT